MRCSMTGIPIRNSGDGIWDDGEWISWVYINEQLARQENANTEDELPSDDRLPSPHIFGLVSDALDQEAESQEPSHLWGKIGELYVAERFGVILSRDYAQGHDGRLGNHHVEIKTITSNKARPFVRVKRSGNFSLLAIVRVDEAHSFEVRFIRRKRLPAHDKGQHATIAWSTACRIGERQPPVPEK